MNQITRERFRCIESLFLQALALDEQQIEDLLAGLEPEEEWIGKIVLSLLERDKEFESKSHAPLSLSGDTRLTASRPLQQELQPAQRDS